LLIGVATWALADDNDTPKAAAARKLLKQKVTVDWKDEAFRTVMEELREQVKGLFFRPDTKSGVQLNTKITLSMKEAPLEQVLNAICDKNGWGYYIISNEKVAYDGNIVVKVGKERGYEEGKEPKTAKKDDDGKDKKAEKTKAKDKVEAKGKKKAKDDDDEPKEKADKDKGEAKEKPAEDPDRAERAAALKLKTAKELIADDKKERAKEVLEDLVKRYSKTKAAEEAKKLLEKLEE
jgi:hypothetical protein